MSKQIEHRINIKNDFILDFVHYEFKNEAESEKLLLYFEYSDQSLLHIYKKR